MKPAGPVDMCTNFASTLHCFGNCIEQTPSVARLELVVSWFPPLLQYVRNRTGKDSTPVKALHDHVVCPAVAHTLPLVVTNGQFHPLVVLVGPADNSLNSLFKVVHDLAGMFPVQPEQVPVERKIVANKHTQAKDQPSAEGLVMAVTQPDNRCPVKQARMQLHHAEVTGTTLGGPVLLLGHLKTSLPHDLLDHVEEDMVRHRSM